MRTHAYDSVTFHKTKKDAIRHSKVYDQYGRFRICKRGDCFVCFGYEWGLHPYSR